MTIHRIPAAFLAMSLIPSVASAQIATSSGGERDAVQEDNLYSESYLTDQEGDNEEADGESEKMRLARDDYERGLELIRTKNDYSGALIYFSKALCHVRLPKTLFAVAQCKKTLGRDIEALFFFAESLNLNYLMELQYNLDRDRLETTKDNIEMLTKRLLVVTVRAPEDDPIVGVSQGEHLLLETNLYGFWQEKKHLAGVARDMVSTLYRYRNRRGQGGMCARRDEQASDNIGEKISELGLRPRLGEADDLRFLIKPGVYSFEFTLKSGRRIHIEDKSIYARMTIDLNSDEWPAQLVIDTPSQETEIVLRENTERNGEIHRRVVFSNVEESVAPSAGKWDENMRDDAPDETIAIKGLKAGSYDLTATRSGFIDFKKTYRLEVGQKKVVDLDLRPTPVYKNWKFWLGMGLTAAAVSVGVSVPLTLRENRL